MVVKKNRIKANYNKKKKTTYKCIEYVYKIVLKQIEL